MKTIALTTLLLCLSSTTFAIDFSTNDKKLHMGISTSIAILTQSTLIYDEGRSMKTNIKSFFIANIPGLFKELADASTEGNKFDIEDIAANSIGVLAGIAITNTTHSVFFTKDTVFYTVRF